MTPIAVVHGRSRIDRRFLFYSLFAWGAPISVVLAAQLIEHLPTDALAPIAAPRFASSCDIGVSLADPWPHANTSCSTCWFKGFCLVVSSIALSLSYIIVSRDDSKDIAMYCTETERGAAWTYWLGPIACLIAANVVLIVFTLVKLLVTQQQPEAAFAVQHGQLKIK